MPNFLPFDIRQVIKRLLLKGSILVKKAFCESSWPRSSY